jgi:DNA repair protein RecN (Recombination protein N)
VLIRLSIKNYALIEESEILFDSGFSVITGETGAGKSILLGALSLLLGARADRSVLRDPSKKCCVEGVFHGNEKLRTFLSKFELEDSDQIVLRREVASDGKSRSFINDSLVTLQVLKELSSKLIHLNLQKENIRFLSPEFQIEALDAFAQNEFERNTYLQSFQNWKLLENELKRAKNELNHRTKEKEFNQFRFDELEMASLQNENELVMKKGQLDVLQWLLSLKDSSSQTYEQLMSGDSA